jgi:heptosyltransferase II
MKIVVIQTAFPGDVILSAPIFKALKELHTGCHTAAIVRPESTCLLNDNPFIDEIIPFDKYGAQGGIWGLVQLAKKIKGFDIAIIVQRHLRSALIPFLARIPKRIGFVNSSANFLYTYKEKYRSDKHEVERCLGLIGVDNANKRYRPEIYITDELNDFARELLNENKIKGDFAVVAPGSVWPTKRYVHYPEVIDLIYENLGLQVVLLGSQEEFYSLNKIEALSSHIPVNLAGKTNLLQSAAVISKARLVISNDSAPAHLAAAVGTPVVAIFGPTIPSFGFAPYADRAATVDIGDLYCRPCSRHGSKRCPQKHFICMKELQPEKVIEAVKLLLVS